MGLFTRVMVLVTPPTTVVTTWACWATVTVPDLCTVMIGRVDVLAAEDTDVPTWAAAVFSIRVAGLLTMTGEEATFTVAGRVVVPGVTATVLTMVVPAGTLSTVGAEDGGIFCVAAAAAANAAIPLICGLLPITVPWALCVGTTIRTLAGREVTVTGAFPAWLAGLMVTSGVPVVA